jgi:hypothetical protein
MFQSAEQERAALAETPALIRDARGAALADSASDLSRRITAMMAAVHDADAGAMRRQLDGLPFTSS